MCVCVCLCVCLLCDTSELSLGHFLVNTATSCIPCCVTLSVCVTQTRTQTDTHAHAHVPFFLKLLIIK